MRYFSKFAVTVRQLEVFKIATLVLVLANGYQTYYIVDMSKNDKTIIVPPSINSQFSSVGNSFSQEYFDEIGRNLTNGLLNLSPDNIDYAFDSIQQYFSTDPDEAIAIKKYLADEMVRIKKDNIFQSFYFLRTLVNHKVGVFTVEGTLRTSTGAMLMENRKASIDFNYTVENKRIKIKSIKVR